MIGKLHPTLLGFQIAADYYCRIKPIDSAICQLVPEAFQTDKSTLMKDFL